MALDCRGAETSLLAHDVPGRDTVAPVCTRDGLRSAGGGNARVFRRRLRDVLLKDASFLLSNTWINFCNAAAPLELRFERPPLYPPGLEDAHSAQLVPERRQNNGQEQLPEVPRRGSPTLSHSQVYFMSISWRRQPPLWVFNAAPGRTAKRLFAAEQR